MTSVVVKTKDGDIGRVAVEHWADPKIYIMDYHSENGDFWPVERDNLDYIGIEEL